MATAEAGALRATDRNAFLAVSHWPALDGLRTVSILLVVLFHSTDPLWRSVDGRMGVTLFFVISGFLITTLLLREEERRGRVSLGAFYVRRVFRIAPLYYLALLATAVLVLVLGVGERTDGFVDKLPLLATFNGEFSGPGTFTHSWSLGIEEKFYVLWPLLGFAFLPLAAHRLPLLVLLVPVTLAASYAPGLGYLGIYFPIAAGCLLAALAHDGTWHRVWQFLSRRATAYVTLAVMVALFLLDGHMPQEESKFAHSPFAVATVLALPGLISSDTRVRSGLSRRWMVRVGVRAYAIYLFHPGVIQFVDVAIAPGQQALAPQLLRAVLIVAGSLLVAEVLGRLVEAPCIQLGRRLAARVSRGAAPRVGVPLPDGEHPGAGAVLPAVPPQRGRDSNPR